MSEVPGRPADKKSTPISHEILATLQNFTIPHGKAPGVVAQSPPPGSVAQVCSESASGFWIGYLRSCCFFQFDFARPYHFVDLWYWYCVARLKGDRGIGVGATFAEVFLASTSSQLDEKVCGPRFTDADPTSHRVRLWRGGSASTPAFFYLFFPFVR